MRSVSSPMDSFSIRDAMVMISCREYGDALMSASICWLMLFLKYTSIVSTVYTADRFLSNS